MELLFWLSFAVVVYVYFGYPALLLVCRRISPRPVQKRYVEPTVSIVIAAHNESERLERRIQNCLSVDYPRRKLQIIVSLDGPTDGSERVVWKYARQGVQMVHSKEHGGKAVALNRAMQQATGEIVVFADARQTFDRRAIRELVGNFADETVGAVSGELLLLDGLDRESATDVGLYWRYEKALRSMESEIHSVAGATGAIYGIRRCLFEQLPEDTILDDVLTPLRILLKGKRVVFDPAAKAYDSVSCCSAAEYGRKVRTLCGNYQLLVALPQIVLPWRNPIFVQFISHKIARLLVPWALLAMFASNLLLLHGFYALTFSLQLMWYGCSIAGHVMSKRELAEPALIPAENERAA